MISKEGLSLGERVFRTPKTSQIQEFEEVSDMELIEVARKSGIDLLNEAHLLLVVEDVLYNAKNAVKLMPNKNKWSFRYKDDGTCYWINTETFLTCKQCPYIKEGRV